MYLGNLENFIGESIKSIKLIMCDLNIDKCFRFEKFNEISITNTFETIQNCPFAAWKRLFRIILLLTIEENKTIQIILRFSETVKFELTEFLEILSHHFVGQLQENIISNSCFVEWQCDWIFCSLRSRSGSCSGCWGYCRSVKSQCCQPFLEVLDLEKWEIFEIWFSITF